MMELSAPQTEKGNGTTNANGGPLHHPFVYPTDLRVLGYTAGVSVLPGSNSSVGHNSLSSLNSPSSSPPNNSGAVPLLLSSSSSSSVGSPSSSHHPPYHQTSLLNGFPRNLLFSQTEKAAAAAAFFWTNNTGTGSSNICDGASRDESSSSGHNHHPLRHQNQLSPISPHHNQNHHNLQSHSRFAYSNEGDLISQSGNNNNYPSRHSSGGGGGNSPRSLSPCQSPPSPVSSVTAVPIIHSSKGTTTTTNGEEDQSGGESLIVVGGSPNHRQGQGSNAEGNNHNGGEGSSSSGGSNNNNAQLMHWMSAVMAEHMNHHNNNNAAAADGVHYVWNGGNNASLLEGKLNSPENHHNSIKTVDPTSPTLPHLYGAPRSNNSGSSVSSSPPSSAGLVVPQPLSSGHGNGNKGPHNSNTVNGGTGRKYQCKMCPQIFTSKADLQLHTQIHMREAKPYKCSQCTKAFANSSYLSQHTRIHLGIKPYRCEICQRKFTQLSHLQQHIRTHTGDKPYKCRHPGCNKAFSQLSNLQSHSRCHQTDKPYKCNSCYKCFTDEASLLDHIPKHKESKHLKTHICNYCGKSYTQETYLTKHMQKHAEKSEKRMARQNNNNNNNNNNHHQTNGSGNTNGQAHQVNNHQNSNSNNVLPSPEMYWKPELGESSPPSMCLPGSGGLIGRPGSEGPDDLRVNNLGQHHPAQPSTPTSLSYDAIANVIASTKSAGASAFTPIQTSAMLQLPANMGGGGAPTGRAYLPYEPLSFQKSGHHQMSAMDMKSPGNAFPNQLISLHQIRNYAHQPTMTPEHLLGLKDK